MDKYKDFRKSGLFKISSDVEVPGELSLKGGAASAEKQKIQKHEARQLSGFVYLPSDRLYSRPTDFITFHHNITSSVRAPASR